MIGIIVILAISWLILYIFEKKDLRVLGFIPTKQRIKQFIYGVLFTSVLYIVIQLFDYLLTSKVWSLSDEISFSLFLNSLWWDIKSVLTEELLFRGALLYILIKKIGVKRSVLISGAAFGVYHWFSYGMFGNLIPMIIIFVGTGLMGCAWAWAFSKTESILLPFGLHLSWNFLHNTIFSKGPLGSIVLISSGGAELDGLPLLVNFMLPLILAPIIVLLYVKYFVLQEHKSSPEL